MNSFTSFIGQFFILAIIAIFVENTVFSRALGTSRAIALSKRPRNIFLYGVTLTFITLISSFFCWLFNHYVGNVHPAFIPISYIIIIGIIYSILFITCKFLTPKFFKKIGYFLPVATFNCATLGSIFLSIHQKYNLWQFISFGLGTGIGFTLATYLVVNGIKKLNDKNLPKAFEGFPIMLLYIGIISLAFYSLIGHQLPF